MTGKELIRRLLAHDSPPRLGADFNPPHFSDMQYVSIDCLTLEPELEPLRHWGEHPVLLEKVPHFRGQVMLDAFGNILGRLNGITKGECVCGCLTAGWEGLPHALPQLNEAGMKAAAGRYTGSDKYVVAGSPFAVFSCLRDARLMPNALMDVLLEPEMVEQYLEGIVARNLRLIDGLAAAGCDAMIMCDDWGTQDRTFISPAAFRALFCPAYKAISDRLHGHGMAFLLHSCGNNTAFLEDMLAAGADALQFDQLGLYCYERMAEEYAGRTVFYSPLDIQKTLPTGDRALIEAEAYRMISAFRKAGGGLLLKDYPTYQDIGVKEEWAGWARDVFLANLSL